MISKILKITYNMNMIIIIKNIIFFAIFLTYSVSIVADDVSRPSHNNKSGVSKKTQEEINNSFIHKLLKGELENENYNSKDLERIKHDIDELKKEKTLSNNSIDSNDRIIMQIKTLSDLKNQGILTENEFNDKKKLLLDRLE